MRIEEFKQSVSRHWKHHAPCLHLNWKVEATDDGWQISVAPIYQEVVGGQQDGEKVWSGFRFDLSAFFAEWGLLVESVNAASFCVECNETPYVGVRGTYFAKPFNLRVHLEPIPGSTPVEAIDILKGQVRAIEEKQP